MSAGPGHVRGHARGATQIKTFQSGGEAVFDFCSLQNAAGAARAVDGLLPIQHPAVGGVDEAAVPSNPIVKSALAAAPTFPG